MAEKFSFFDPVQTPDGLFDREYNAQEFTDYFASLVTTGVMKGAGNQLSVSADGSSMITKLNTGVAFIEGRYYANDSLLNHTHDTETVGKSRVDRIVIRMDLSTEARHVISFVKKGVASASPVAPTITQTANVYEISVAQVKVVGGQTFISANNVTDERGTVVICPWTGSRILPNFDDDALQELVDNQLTDGSYAKKYSGNLDELLKTGFYACDSVDTTSLPIQNSSSGRPWIVQVISDSDTKGAKQIASQAISGDEMYHRTRSITGAWFPWKLLVVPLNNTLTSTSTTEAATANAVKTVNDKLQYFNANAYTICLGKNATGNLSLGPGANSTGSEGSEFAIGYEAMAQGWGAAAIGGFARSGNQNQGVLGVSKSSGYGQKTWIVPGDLSVSGTKNFEIPHPHPDKKYTHVIRHGAVESLTTGDTLYRYEIKATEDGQVVEVQLPDYFEQLNTNVDIWVNPHLHFGRAFGIVEGDILRVTCERVGTYKALVIGTRNDENVLDWYVRGVEREIGESWLGETSTFEVDELTEVTEFEEVYQ
ncbi:pyocin knob domain-containing protein [Viridibacillus sp. FSL R5-0468]|uniref:pyocin knob domain-containing protein n=1 Tax=Viridibacillus sp. FSL R5-0468 TaxID=2921640 RepID=UPI0030F59619